MSVQHDASGRRFAAVEIEVPGTPEEVWQAIATGPGMSAWFVPASFEEAGGKPVAMTATFGPGMEVRAPLTAWDPPRRYAKELGSWMPDSPSIADEWTVEARAGGTCIVRIVHSLFASIDDWDDQLEAGTSAWPAFLRTLRIYLTHFRGQRSAIVQLSAPVTGTEAEAWETLTTALGVRGLSAGERWTTPAGPSPLGGVVEYLTEDPYDALLRLEHGVVGLGVFTYPGGGPTMAAMNFYLYGEQADAAAAREAPVWQAWLEERFPSAAAAEA